MKGTFQDRDQIHLGRNVQRVREIVGVKQTALAEACGWSQQQMSKLENSEFIDEGTLDIIASQLGVSAEFIKNFREELAIYNIQSYNTFNDHAINSSQHNKPEIEYNSNDQLVKLLEKFIEEDRKKSDQIEFLTKSVMELAQEIKKMKEGK